MPVAGGWGWLLTQPSSADSACLRMPDIGQEYPVLCHQTRWRDAGRMIGECPRSREGVRGQFPERERLSNTVGVLTRSCR
jgi:hypothetical protein